MPPLKDGTISVLLADDHVILLDSLRLLLEAEGDIAVVASLTDGNEAVRAAQELRPSVAVLDITMPGLNGIDAARQIRQRSLETRVLILSMHASVHYVYEAFAAGAGGYVVKHAASTDLLDALRVVAQGRRYVSATFVGAMLEDFVHRRDAFDGPLRELTARDRQVLRLVVEGKSSAEAGQLLNLTRRTIETYRARIMQKLGLNDLPSLVKFAIRHGLTSVD